MDIHQTAPTVWPVSTLFVEEASNTFQQTKQPKTFVVIGALSDNIKSKRDVSVRFQQLVFDREILTFKNINLG